jgi:hypothetical protein
MALEISVVKAFSSTKLALVMAAGMVFYTAWLIFGVRTSSKACFNSSRETYIIVI